jgi:hypothetical protein
LGWKTWNFTKKNPGSKFKLFKGCIISKIMDTRHYSTTTVRML